MLGFDFHETFSLMVKPITIKVIITFVVTYDWKLFELDVNNSYLNGFFKWNVYIVQPPRFEVENKALVCKLNKAFYGVKQTPRQWFHRLKHTFH